MVKCESIDLRIRLTRRWRRSGYIISRTSNTNGQDGLLIIIDFDLSFSISTNVDGGCAVIDDVAVGSSGHT